MCCTAACLLQLGDEIMLHKHVSECCKFLTSSICVLGFSKNQRWGIRNRACGRLIKEQKVQSSRENSRGFVRAQTSTEKEISKKNLTMHMYACIYVTKLRRFAGWCCDWQHDHFECAHDLHALVIHIVCVLSTCM